MLVELTDTAAGSCSTAAVREANVVESDTLAGLTARQRDQLAALLEVVISGLDDARDALARADGEACDERQRSGNQMAISRAADSGESEPCTMFSWTFLPQSRPRSPRIVPGSAAVGSVAPARARKPSMQRLALDDDGGRPGRWT